MDSFCVVCCSWAVFICTNVALLSLQYLEIEVKNPRTHIENEKALYTDYEIELKVRHSILSIARSIESFRSDDSSFYRI